MNFIELKNVPIYFESIQIPNVTMQIGKLWKQSRWILAVGSSDYGSIIEKCNKYLFDMGLFSVTDKIGYPVISESYVNFIKLNSIKDVS